MRISIEGVPELNRLRRRYETAPKIVREELGAGMERSLDAVRDEIAARAPDSFKPYIRTNISGSGGLTTGTVAMDTSEKPHIAYQEWGTGVYSEFPGASHSEYVIEPKSKQALAFPVGGRVFVRKKVVHPGVKPKRFFRDGWEAGQQRARFLFRARLGNVTRRLRGG